jgi:CRISPR/Cas system-associated protein Csx1
LEIYIYIYIYIFIFIFIKNNYGNFATWRQKKGEVADWDLYKGYFWQEILQTREGKKKRVEIAIFTP